jgi:hypothetical protein
MKTLSDLIEEGVYVKREAVRVIVTPACAEAALKLNIGNRHVIKSNVEFMAMVMKSGEWCDDHTQGISFSDTGRLIDGQHRLMGVVASRKSVLMRVDTGASEAVRQHLDMGKARRLCDRVDLLPDKFENKLATELINGWVRIKTQHARKIALGTVVCVFERFSSEITWLVALRAKNQNRAACTFIFRGAVMASWMEALQINKAAAEEFIQSVAFPDGASQPGRMLREWLLRNTACSGLRVELETYRIAWSAMESAFANGTIKSIRPLKRDINAIGCEFKSDGK